MVTVLVPIIFLKKICLLINCLQQQEKQHEYIAWKDMALPPPLRIKEETGGKGLSRERAISCLELVKGRKKVVSH